MQPNNIPLELQKLQQWVCWRLVHTDKGRLTKLPFCPTTGKMASVTDPSTWVSFREALKHINDYSGIGLVLTNDDPYAIIDLDKPVKEEQATRHQRIINEFESYAELSPSGEGVHIVVKGNVRKGMNKDKVEVYSSERYMTFTGNIINHYKIQPYQEKLNILVSEATQEYNLNETSLHEFNREETVIDSVILDTARNATNKIKFEALWKGDWQLDYKSQSEADNALISMLAFYTENNEQVRRLFRMSALGQRSKAVLNNKYVDRTLLKVRASAPPEIDTRALLAAAETVTIAPSLEQHIENDITFPPGLVGDIADYIYKSSLRPVKVISLMAALGLTAGISGRAFNVSHTGLNLYLLLVCPTGRGKEEMAKGMESLFSAIENKIPCADDFIGAGTYASGQGLVKTLDKKPCAVSLLSEFGETFFQMTDKKAGAHMGALRRVMLDIYSKSGRRDVLRPTVYSDAEKNTDVVRSPSLTLLCETEPVGFFSNINRNHIMSGLLPRFSVVEYNGKRPPTNKNARFNPPNDLIDDFANFVEKSLDLQVKEEVIDIEYTPEALCLLDQFDAFADDLMNKAPLGSADNELWNRSHLKVLKLSGLIAVGANIHVPIITKEYVEWAIAFVKRDVKGMLRRFAEGDVGEGASAQEYEARKVFEAFFKLTKKEKKEMKLNEAIINGNVVPYRYIKKNLYGKSCFASDTRGASFAVNRTLTDMAEDGSLVEVDRTTARNKFGTQAKIYGIGENWHQ